MTSIGPLGMGPIILTPQIIAGQLTDNITSDQSLMAQLQEQISTGNMVNVASDNPAAAASIMQLNGAVTRSQQYAANASDGLGWLSQGNSTMNEILSTLQQVQQEVISVSSASISGNPTALQALAAQVTSAQQELVQLSNTQYNGQAIFAGTGNVSAAYDANGNYLGGGAAPTRTVAPGTRVTVAVGGPAVFGSGSTGLLGNTAGNMGVLAQIASDISTGTPASLNQVVTTDLQNLQNATSQVESQAAVLGAGYQQMQAFSQQATNTQQALTTELSGIQSTNMPQAITELTQAQNSYQEALWAASKVSQASLVQYLS
jgi:flagellar hook-associated protein 3 FlgL